MASFWCSRSAMEAHHGAVEAHHGAMEAHQVIMEAHHGAQEAHLGAVEAHHSTLEAHQGAVFSGFKRRYHGFAPTIEIDQMVSSNSYYVALNGFMLFKTRGLIKKFKQRFTGTSLKEYLSIGTTFNPY
jgi:hypothetical protein